MKDQIKKVFLELVKIPTATKQESQIADYIEKYMSDLDWKVWRDSSQSETKSNTGNVYAYKEINPEFETIAFCAHMDTVQSINDQIKVIEDNDIIKSDSTTILGADNKAGITELLILSEQIDHNSKYNILLFFPTCEEAGLMGSGFFEFDRKIKYFFNIDGAGGAGTFFYKALGYVNFEIIIKGLSAHAAVEYEKGKNAIKAAGELIHLLDIGKNIDEGWTANIGKMDGGNKTNVVPDLVTMKCELRAFSDEIMNGKLEEFKKVCEDVATKHNLDVNLVKEDKSYIQPFNGSLASDIVKICSQACINISLEPAFNEAFFTSDANSLTKACSQIITVARGGEKAHTNEESINLKDMEMTINLLKSLLT